MAFSRVNHKLQSNRSEFSSPTLQPRHFFPWIDRPRLKDIDLVSHLYIVRGSTEMPRSDLTCYNP